jgi:tetratricopeptide (TPR) repeat protein
MTFLKRPVLLCLLAFSWCEHFEVLLAQQSDRAALERYFQEGEKALAEGRFDEAAKAYEKLSQLDPKTAEVHAKLGLIYYQLGRFAEAIPSFRQALRLKPGLPGADVILAVCLSELGHYSEALPGLEKGFRSSSDASLRRLIGLQLQRSYVGLQRYSKAAEITLELDRTYPDDPEVLYHAGRFYGDFAFLKMQRLARVAPDSVWMLQATGEAHESRGHYDLAIREYRKVLAMEPARPGIHFRIGRAILSGSREAGQNEALKEFEQELELDPTNAGAAYETGEIYRKLGELDKAQKFFGLAVKHDPGFEEALVGLGRVLTELKEPEKALPHLQAAIRINPDNEVARYRLVLVHRAMGNTPEQQREFKEFERIRAQNLKHLNRAQPPPSQLTDSTKQELDSEPTQ